MTSPMKTHAKLLAEARRLQERHKDAVWEFEVACNANPGEYLTDEQERLDAIATTLEFEMRDLLKRISTNWETRVVPALAARLVTETERELGAS